MNLKDDEPTPEPPEEAKWFGKRPDTDSSASNVAPVSVHVGEVTSLFESFQRACPHLRMELGRYHPFDLMMDMPSQAALRFGLHLNLHADELHLVVRLRARAAPANERPLTPLFQSPRPALSGHYSNTLLFLTSPLSGIAGPFFLHLHALERVRQKCC